MKITFEKIDDQNIQSALREVAKRVFDKASKIIALDENIEINFIKATGNRSLVDLDGVSGCCYDADKVTIRIDTKLFNKNDSYSVERTLAHELFHASDIKKGVDIINGTMREFLINEGSADLFSKKITGKIPIWARALSKKEIDHYWKIIKPILNIQMNDELYYKWFIDGDEKIPKWTGYSIGYWFVENKLK